MNNRGLLKLLQICDSLFPVGAFTLSNGLETYVQKGIITSANHLQEYLDSYICVLQYNELGAAALAYSGHDLKQLDEIYNACKSPIEIRTGSRKTANRFFRVAEKTFPDSQYLNEYKNLIKQGECVGHQSIAYGLFMRDCEIELSQALNVYGYSICSAIVTNCVKLVPLSQLEGQRVLAESFEKIDIAVKNAQHVTIDEIGITGAGFDFNAMRHEQLYSRQYMS